MYKNFVYLTVNPEQLISCSYCARFSIYRTRAHVLRRRSFIRGRDVGVWPRRFPLDFAEVNDMAVDNSLLRSGGELERRFVIWCQFVCGT